MNADSLETRVSQLELEVSKIKMRNRRVEGDKAWETSKTRRAILTFLTYISIGIYMQAVGIERPWINAIVPAVAFMLSTLTLPFFKKFWLRYVYKRS